MSDVLATIRSYSRWWADPDPYKVTGGDLRTIFSEAGCEQIPTSSEASYSADYLGNGCRIGGQTKHWCGIFAAMVLRYAGIDVRWSLTKGGMVTDKSQVEYLPAYGNLDSLGPGDVAVIPKANHHFLVVDNLWDWYGSPILITIEGNTTGQRIKSNTRPLKDPVLDQRIYGFYHLKV